MSGREALQGFIDKWRVRWPEWAAATAFVPTGQREVFAAWLALRDELADAAWGGDDARPGAAKLGWWSEELLGWSKGVRRHPLGLALQSQAADWTSLGEGLDALQATRGVGSVDAAKAALAPFAGAASAVAVGLFGATRQGGATEGEGVSLLAERLLRESGAAPASDVTTAASGLLAAWPAEPDVTRPMRIHHAFVQRRLLRLRRGQAPTPGPFRSLFDAWAAARR